MNGVYTRRDLQALAAARRAIAGGDELPLVTIHGDTGYANVYHDRVELFLPALFALAAPYVIKAAAPLASSLLAKGKELVGSAVSSAVGGVAEAGKKLIGLGGGEESAAEEAEGEEEESGEEEEDSYGPFEGPAEEDDPPGVYVMEDRVQLFLPYLMGAAAPLLGGISRLFEKKRKRRDQPQQTPGRDEPELVSRAVEEALAEGNTRQEFSRLQEKLEAGKEREAKLKEEKQELRAHIAQLQAQIVQLQTRLAQEGDD